MVFEKEQSHKFSLMAALLAALIRIVFLPVWLVVVILYEAHVIYRVESWEFRRRHWRQ